MDTITLTDTPACWKCAHYNSQFSDRPEDKASGYCGFDRHSLWVEGDHYCKRFTLIGADTPATWDALMGAWADYLVDQFGDDRSTTVTLLDWAVNRYEIAPEAFIAYFGGTPAWEYEAVIIPEWRKTFSGGYYEPDEYAGHAEYAVYVNDKPVLDGAGSCEDAGDHVAEMVDVYRKAVTAVAA